jgi:hypothetical protein
MTTRYPSVTIVAGPIQPTRGPAVASGHILRMHDYAFIHIDPETAKQWISVLSEIAEVK